MFNGKGTIKYKNKKIYIGDIVNGKCDGIGIKIHPNGTVYEGGWKNNYFYGVGTLISKYLKDDNLAINKVVGDWDDCVIFGVITLNNGDRYNGKYEIPNLYPRLTLIHGEGKIYYANGDIYDGSIKFGVLSNGEIRYKNNGFFKGVFENNNPWCGKGEIYIDDDIYIGDFVDGVLNGNCKIKYKSGILTGIFDNFGCDGQFISNNGETISCRFKRTKDNKYFF